MKNPNPTLHFFISLAKSIIRIGGCVTAIVGVTLAPASACLVFLAGSLLVAEILGVLEEIF